MNKTENENMLHYSSKIFRLSCVIFFLTLSSSCSLLTDGETRVGCVEEKIQDDGYTEEFAQDICEGEYYMYGEDKPQYEVELDELEAEWEELESEWDAEWEELESELETLDEYWDCVGDVNMSLSTCELLYG